MPRGSTVPAVWCLKIQERADGHDAGRIDGRVAAVIVVLDVVETAGLGNTGNLIEFAQIAAEIGVIGYAADVAFEVADIDRIKPQKRGEQPPVGLGDTVAGEIAVFRQ